MNFRFSIRRTCSALNGFRLDFPSVSGIVPRLAARTSLARGDTVILAENDSNDSKITV